MRTLFFWVSIFLIGLSGPAMGWAQDGQPVEAPGRSAVEAAQGSFIFVFDPRFVSSDDVPGLARGLAQQHGAALGHIYTHAIQGFSAKIPAEGAEQLANQNPLIQYYEPDGVVWMVDPPSATPAKKPEGSPGKGPNKKEPPPEEDPPAEDPPAEDPLQPTPWGIALVGGWADASVAVNGSIYEAWIIDTGIDQSHPDLNHGSCANFSTGASCDDGNGHGTHVAGTVAAINNTFDVVGVSAGATVHAVRVLDNRGSGTVSGVVAGVDHVAANGQPGDCANMSLTGTGHFQSLHDAVFGAAENFDIRFALAAGNNGADADGYEPAHVNHANVFTAAAIDVNLNFASFSNYGIPPVDFAAPGVNILSLKVGGGTRTLSGTSMAAPHVCGVLLQTTPAGLPGSSRTASGPPGNTQYPIVEIP